MNEMIHTIKMYSNTDGLFTNSNSSLVANELFVFNDRVSFE